MLQGFLVDGDSENSIKVWQRLNVSPIEEQFQCKDDQISLLGILLYGGLHLGLGDSSLIARLQAADASRSPSVKQLMDVYSMVNGVPVECDNPLLRCFALLVAAQERGKAATLQQFQAEVEEGLSYVEGPNSSRSMQLVTRQFLHMWSAEASLMQVWQLNQPNNVSLIVLAVDFIRMTLTDSPGVTAPH